MSSAADLHPSARLASSRRKIRAPFTLDSTLCLYSPQANVDALTHPRIAEWLDFVQRDWTPTPVEGAHRRLALLLPCTKYKPYATSREHRGINAALLETGWRPHGEESTPAELLRVLADSESPDLLRTGPLVRDGVVLDRFVLSEPLAVVPYEHTMFFAGGQAPATSYDDPGLFEARGTSVSPERADCTASPRPGGGWSWGPAERDAYARMHNAMAAAITGVLRRLAPSYAAVVAWVSPGLTHRSFLAGADVRAADGLPTTRDGLDGPVALTGVGDTLPGLVEVLPTREQLADARDALRDRLTAQGRRATPSSVGAVFARGDGHDTPLGLPELAGLLATRLGELAGAV
jgi:hypothetical protein